MADGWIKLHRKARHSSIWKNWQLWRLFEWCLMEAAHKPVTVYVGYQAVDLQPGQLIFGRRMAHQGTGLSEQTVRTCLHALTSGNDPVLTIQSTKTHSIVTIINWGKYQKEDAENNRPSTNRPTNSQPTTNQRPTTNKNDQELINLNSACAHRDGEDTDLSEEEYRRFEAQFSPSSAFVLDAWRAEREKVGLRYIRSPRNIRAAFSIAGEIDAGNWAREDVSLAIRNFLSDEWARTNLTLANLYEDFEKWLNYSEKKDDRSKAGRNPSRSNAGKAKADFSDVETGSPL